MSKVFVATLGYILIFASVMDFFLQYVVLDISWLPIIIIFFFLSFFFLGFERLPILKDRRFIIYFSLLFVTIVLFTTINTNYDISNDYLLYYVRVLRIFIILFSFYLIINNISFSTFIRYSFLSTYYFQRFISLYFGKKVCLIDLVEY